MIRCRCLNHRQLLELQGCAAQTTVCIYLWWRILQQASHIAPQLSHLQLHVHMPRGLFAQHSRVLDGRTHISASCRMNWPSLAVDCSLITFSTQDLPSFSISSINSSKVVWGRSLRCQPAYSSRRRRKSLACTHSTLSNSAVKQPGFLGADSATLGAHLMSLAFELLSETFWEGVKDIW